MHRGRTDGCRFFSGWTALHHPGIQLGPSRIEQVFTVCLCKRLIASHKAAEFIVHDRVQMVQYDQARTVREPSGLRLCTSTLVLWSVGVRSALDQRRPKDQPHPDADWGDATGAWPRHMEED